MIAGIARFPFIASVDVIPDFQNVVHLFVRQAFTRFHVKEACRVIYIGIPLGFEDQNPEIPLDPRFGILLYFRSTANIFRVQPHANSRMSLFVISSYTGGKL